MVDAPIFIYHFTGVSEQCREFLARCERGVITAKTSAVIIAEVTHRLMMIEAVARGFVQPGQVVKKLRAQPEIVRKLRLYDEQVRQIPWMEIEVIPLQSSTLFQAAEVRRQEGLLTNDSAFVATARADAITTLVTADRDFTRLRDVQVFAPTDLA